MRCAGRSIRRTNGFISERTKPWNTNPPSAVSLLPTAHRSRPTDDRWSRSSVIRRQSSISARTARSFIRTRSTCRRFCKKGKVSGVLLSVFGGIGLGTFGLTALIMAIIWAATSSASLGGMTILFGLMAAACGGVLKRGGGLCKRLGRAERYLKLAGEEMYIRISELSEKPDGLQRSWDGIFGR